MNTHHVILTRDSDGLKIEGTLAETPTGGVQLSLGYSPNSADTVEHGRIIIPDINHGSGQMMLHADSDPKKYEKLVNSDPFTTKYWLASYGWQSTILTTGYPVANESRRAAIFQQPGSDRVIVTPKQIYEGLDTMQLLDTAPTGYHFTGGYAIFGDRTFFGVESDNTDRASGPARVRTNAGANTVYGTGTFTKSVTPGTTSQNVAHGMGVAPKAIICWTSGKTVDGVISAGHRRSFGFSDLTTQYGWGATSQDAVTPANNARWQGGAVILLPSASAASGPSAAIISSDTVNFRLDWSLNDAVADIIHWVAIGGADVQAKVVAWEPSGTGSRAVTGVGFKPTVVLHNGNGALASPASEYSAFIGGMDDNGNQFNINVGGQDNVNPSNTWRQHRTTNCIAAMTVSAGTDLLAARYTSMDADGFTVNVDTELETPNIRVGSLCLRGLNARITTVAKPVGAGPASQAVTGIGFTPTALMLFSNETATLNTALAHARATIGAATSTGNESAASASDTDAVNPSSVDGVDNLVASGRIFDKFDNDTQTREAAAALTSFDSGGFTLSWNPNDAVAMQFSALVLGSGPVYANAGFDASYFAIVGDKMYRTDVNAASPKIAVSWTDETGNSTPGWSTIYTYPTQLFAMDMAPLGPNPVIALGGVPSMSGEVISLDIGGSFSNIVPRGFGELSPLRFIPYLGGLALITSGPLSKTLFMPSLTDFDRMGDEAQLTPFLIDDFTKQRFDFEQPIGLGVSGPRGILEATSGDLMIVNAGDDSFIGIKSTDEGIFAHNIALAAGRDNGVQDTGTLTYTLTGRLMWDSIIDSMVLEVVGITNTDDLYLFRLPMWTGLLPPGQLTELTQVQDASYISSYLSGDSPVVKKFTMISGHWGSLVRNAENPELTIKAGLDHEALPATSIAVLNRTDNAGHFHIELDETWIDMGIKLRVQQTSQGQSLTYLIFPIIIDYIALPYNAAEITLGIQGGSLQMTRGGTISKQSRRLVLDTVESMFDDRMEVWTLKWWDGRPDWKVVPTSFKTQETEVEARPGEGAVVVSLGIKRLRDANAIR